MNQMRTVNSNHESIKSNRKNFNIKLKLLKSIFAISKYTLLVGLSFIILYPFLVKLSSVFMSQEDFVDKTVKMIPRNPTFFNLINVIEGTEYFKSLQNTFVVSTMTGILQTFFATFVGYGFAKFKFRGNSMIFAMVVITMIIPPQTLSIPYYMYFKNFDIFGIFSILTGHNLRLLDTMWPSAILSITGLGFKNGLYIFMMRQFFKGIPHELNEASDVDGAGVFATYFKIILPLAIPMMLTVFLFSFSWQWTDSYYSELFFISFKSLSKVISLAGTLAVNNDPTAANSVQSSVFLNTASFLVVIPLGIIFVFAQKKFVQGVESSGIVG